MIFDRTSGGLNFGRQVGEENSDTIINALKTDYKQDSHTGNSKIPASVGGCAC